MAEHQEELEKWQTLTPEKEQELGVSKTEIQGRTVLRCIKVQWKEDQKYGTTRYRVVWQEVNTGKEKFTFLTEGQRRAFVDQLKKISAGTVTDISSMVGKDWICIMAKTTDKDRSEKIFPVSMVTPPENIQDLRKTLGYPQPEMPEQRPSQGAEQ